ncbi:hypothetical protein [Micromonospora sp. LOL_023]|uniref:hypothetical protein n=1 Tax=Micromonospora sp. LOL_023 TaxID=3345418 RepID=UPI003A876449
MDCYGTRQVRRGAVLTVTGLRGPTVWRLPEHYRVGLLAAEFGVQPVDLTDLDGETVVEQHLRDGVVHLADPNGDPVGTYLAEVVATHHAARLLVRANDWAGPSLDDLARLVVGLALDVTVVDHRRNGARSDLPQGGGWQVAVVDPAAAVAVGPAGPPRSASPQPGYHTPDRQPKGRQAKQSGSSGRPVEFCGELRKFVEQLWRWRGLRLRDRRNTMRTWPLTLTRCLITC